MEGTEDCSILQAFGVSKVIRNPKPATYVVWSRRRNNCVKLNTDGCAESSLGQIKGGDIFRDHIGVFLGGFSASFGVGFTFEAELAVALMGIEIAHPKG